MAVIAAFPGPERTRGAAEDARVSCSAECSPFAYGHGMFYRPDRGNRLAMCLLHCQRLYESTVLVFCLPSQTTRHSPASHLGHETQWTTLRGPHVVNVWWSDLTKYEDGCLRDRSSLVP
ncbi:hypothetical protein POX_d05134 [Penicillium oxalicum]|uniref:hypothetical protein n=1 Tax=Penicillium oxalicum TaxID=69781 RepID=UPI0020B8D22D|nr:hypothetical protein POX_d05134 [Penicillium oxalicum]KAI2789639.1 hypothetical protein POX_d05134 [Penicillium oxalicum]